MQNSTKGRFRILRNYGRQDDTPKERTTPDWVLLRRYKGEGQLADKPHFLIIEGLGMHEPMPAVPLPYPARKRNLCPRANPMRSQIRRQPEMLSKHNAAHNMYHGTGKLSEKLIAAG